MKVWMHGQTSRHQLTPTLCLREASNLYRVGVDVEHIMMFSGWGSLDMVLRYTRSVRFEESLRLYMGMGKD